MTNSDEFKKPFFKRILTCVKGALRPSLKSAVWLLIITIPVSFGVTLLKLSGILYWMAGLCEPLFKLFGLPGESALVFLTSCLLNIYSAIAVIKTLGLTGRVVTILALMCLISHNLFVETAVQKKIGSSMLGMMLVRLSASFMGAILLNMILPPEVVQEVITNTQALVEETWQTVITDWAIMITRLSIKIIILITLLMILQRILQEFGIIRILSYLLKYPLTIVGLPLETAFMWIVANTLGLAYGGGVIIAEVEQGKLQKKHADILNYHIAISHSLLEDSFLFAAIGVPIVWITIPRVILAGLFVWARHAWLKISHKGTKDTKGG